MSRAQRAIVREIRAANDRRRGTVLTELRKEFFRPAQLTGAMWVTDVAVSGADQVLRDVPVKINGHRARSYAAVGRPVFIERNARGRWQVIGPADRQVGQGSIVELDLDTDVATPSALSSGFTFRREPFEFYEGGGVGSSLWNDGITPFPKTSIIGPDGSIIP